MVYVWQDVKRWIEPTTHEKKEEVGRWNDEYLPKCDENDKKMTIKIKHNRKMDKREEEDERLFLNLNLMYINRFESPRTLKKWNVMRE